MRGEMIVNKVLEEIMKIGIVPVVTIDCVEDAIPLAMALCNGGIPCAEVTFRTKAAKYAIKEMLKEYPDMMVGAGTILNIEQAEEAIEAGAKFIVSPGFNSKVVKYCIDNGVVIIPGCNTPSNIEEAIEFGLDTVKFFPAEASGGLNMIKAMSAPYGNIKFMPTGGINIDNLNTYLGFNKIIACGGTWMATKQLIKEGKFEEIKNITRAAVEKMLGFELLHIGVNTKSNEEANNIANDFKKLFGFKSKENSNSIFLGNNINIMKSISQGKNGYLAIGTNNIIRAIWHLESCGYMVDENSKFFNGYGELISVYITKEIGGYVIKLIQK